MWCCFSGLVACFAGSSWSDQVGGALCFPDPIVMRLVIRSSTSEGLLLDLDGILPQVEKAEEKEEENAADEDQQKPVQESVST